MENVLNVSTLLGGLVALWFLYDKRLTIANWFKISFEDAINPLSLPDEEFRFIENKAAQFLGGSYLPVNQVEEQLCKSLANLGLLKQVGKNKFKLTGIGKKLLSSKIT